MESAFSKLRLLVSFADDVTYNSDQGAMDGEFYGHAAVGFRGRVSDLIRLSFV